MHYDITVTPQPYGLLLSDITAHHDDGRRSLITRQVLDTQDAAVREGLIKLGWTPPRSK